MDKRLRKRVLLAAILAGIAIGIFAYFFLSHSNERRRVGEENAQRNLAPKVASISGMVVGCYGDPILDATIHLSALEATQNATASVDPEGAFIFVGIPVGKYHVIVSSVTWGELEQDILLLDEARLVLTIPGRSRVEGRIQGQIMVQGETELSHSAFGNTIVLRVFRFSKAGLEVLVDDLKAVWDASAGVYRFNIQTLGVGHFKLRAVESAWVSESEFDINYNGQVKMLDLALSPSPDVVLGAVVIYGTAYLGEKIPLANTVFEVDVIRPNGVTAHNLPARQVSTDAQGAYSFKLRAVESGTILKYYCPHAKPVVVQVAEDVIRNFRFDPQFERFEQSKICLLTTIDQIPVANSRVELITPHRESRWTDDEGIFSLDGIDAGRYEAQIYCNTFGKELDLVGVIVEVPANSESLVRLQIDVKNSVNIKMMDTGGELILNGFAWYSVLSEGERDSATYYKVDFVRPGRVFLSGLPYEGSLNIAGCGIERPHDPGRPPVMPTYSELTMKLGELQPPNEMILQLKGSRVTDVRLIDGQNRPVRQAFAASSLSDVRPPRQAGPGAHFRMNGPVFSPQDYFASQGLVSTPGKGEGSYDLFVFDDLDRDIGLFSAQGAAVIKKSVVESYFSQSFRTIQLGLEGFVVGSVESFQGDPVSGCRLELSLGNGKVRSTETFSNGTFFLYAADSSPQQLFVLPGDGNKLIIDSPSIGIRKVIQLSRK